jgi:hypothetical protein
MITKTRIIVAIVLALLAAPAADAEVGFAAIVKVRSVEVRSGTAVTCDDGKGLDYAEINADEGTFLVIGDLACKARSIATEMVVTLSGVVIRVRAPGGDRRLVLLVRSIAE